MKTTINIWFITKVTKISQFIHSTKCKLSKNWKKLGCIGCATSLLLSVIIYCIAWLWDANSYKRNPGIVQATKLIEWSLTRNEESQTYFFLYMKFKSKPFNTPKSIAPEGIVLSEINKPDHKIRLDIVDIDDYKNIYLPKIRESSIILNYDPISKFMQIQPADSIINEKRTSFISPVSFPLLNKRLFEYPFAPTKGEYTDKILIFKQKLLTEEEKSEGYKNGSQSIYSMPAYCQFQLIGENVPTTWFPYYNANLGFTFYPYNPVKLEPDEMVKANLYGIQHKLINTVSVNNWTNNQVSADILKDTINRFEHLVDRNPEIELYKIYLAIFKSIQSQDPRDSAPLGKPGVLKNLRYDQYINLLDNIYPFSGINHSAFTIFGVLILAGIKVFGETSELCNYNGMYYFVVGKNDSARVEFSKISVNANPKLRNYMKYNKAVTLTKMGKPKDSNLELIKLLEVPYMDHDVIHYIIAENYIQLKQEGLATSEALKIRAKSPYFKQWQVFMENNYSGVLPIPLMCTTIDDHMTQY